jgi:hypothetical protein
MVSKTDGARGAIENAVRRYRERTGKEACLLPLAAENEEGFMYERIS